MFTLKIATSAAAIALISVAGRASATPLFPDHDRRFGSSSQMIAYLNTLPELHILDTFTPRKPTRMRAAP